MGRVELKNIVFLTGATGFLGTQIVRRLIKKENISVIVLVRGQNFEDAHRHLRRAWWEWPEFDGRDCRTKKIYNVGFK